MLSEKPDWLRVKAPGRGHFNKVQGMLAKGRLNTVCSSASCPNLGECWERGTATFMILGNYCTRACRFCHVKTAKNGLPVDLDEPRRLAESAKAMGLKHVVITSVARDDLLDQGAEQFAKCLWEIHSLMPHASTEILVPDFQGKENLIQIVTDARPHIFNHNLETIKRLSKKVRSLARYERSLSVLKTAKNLNPNMKTKSGLMLGMGETLDEVKEALYDLREHNCDQLTLGQYLRPSSWHWPVERYVHPEEFFELYEFAKHLGFSHVKSGPLVRSSYHAEEGVEN